MRAFALCPAHPDVQEYRDDIEFFDSVRIWVGKFDAEERAARGLPNPRDVELALRQLAAEARVRLHAGDFHYRTSTGRYSSLAISGFPSQSRASSNVANRCSRRLKGGGRSF